MSHHRGDDMLLADLLTEVGRILRPMVGAEKPLTMRVAWFVTNIVVLRNPVNPFSFVRAFTLRAFGAKVGGSVTLRPGMRVKFPWKLHIGDGASIGEEVWIDNLEHVEIGAQAVISQGTYFCTGNHDWAQPDMPLVAKPIRVGDRAWVGAMSILGPGVTIGRNALVRLGSVVTKDVPQLDDAARFRHASVRPAGDPLYARRLATNGLGRSD